MTTKTDDITLPTTPNSTLLRRVMPNDYRYGDIYGYTVEQMRGYARAAVEADRARRGEPVAEVDKFGNLRVLPAMPEDAGDMKLYAAPRPAEPVVNQSLTTAEPVKGEPSDDDLETFLSDQLPDFKYVRGGPDAYDLIKVIRAALARYSLQPSVPEPVESGFRWRAGINHAWQYVFGRAPDSYELREAEIQNVVVYGASSPTPPAVEQPISDALRDAVTQGIGIMRLDPTEIYQSSAQQRSMQAAIDDKALAVARSITAMRQTPECQWLARIQIAVAEAMVWSAAGVPNREWQPIDTAPRDGRTMILLLTPSRFPQVAWSNTWWTSGFSVENKPTHWMPLPPFPPTQEPSY